MPSYTTSLRLVQPATGEYSGAWGTQVNDSLTALVDKAVAGTTSITMTAANYTLTNANGVADEAKSMFLVLGGTPGASYQVIVPTASKLYFVTNSTGFAQTVKTSGGSGISVPNGASMTLRCDGTNVVVAENYFASLTLGSALPVASGGTGSTSTTYCSLTTNVTGTLPATNGGTGSSSAFTANGIVYASSTSVLATGSALTFNGSTLAVAGGFQATSYNGGQLAGMRNKIINGKMEIAQRGTSFAAIAGGSYTLDRYRYDATTSAVLTISQQSDVPSSNEFQNSLRATVTPTADTSIAAGDFAIIQQPIEGYNARDLIGRTFTVSFWVRSSKTGTHCVALRNSGENRSYVAEYTVSAANTWEFKSFAVSGGLITAGTWDWTTGRGLSVAWVLAAGTTYQTTANTWQTGSFLATSAQVNVLDAVNNIFAITGVQLEVGGVATPFEHRTYGAELALAQRYYETGDAVQTVKARESDGVRRAFVYYRVTKRASPTVTLSGATADGGTAAPTVGQATVEQFRLDANAGGTTTAIPSISGWTSASEL
jgi:hypothetical protein